MHEDYGTLIYDDLYVGMWVFVYGDGEERLGVIVDLSGPPPNPLQYWKPLLDGKCDGVISLLPHQDDKYTMYGAFTTDKLGGTIKNIRPYLLGDTYYVQTGDKTSEKGFLQ